MRCRGRLLSPSLLVFALALAACGTPGASQPGAKKPETNPVAGASGASGGGEKPGAGVSEPEGPRKPSCTDGSCFECGEGICPAGFYCQKSGGSTGCAWAAECAQKPTCACVAPLTKGCSCEDRGGFPHVTCGSLAARALPRSWRIGSRVESPAPAHVLQETRA